jgi:hypothetical protein
LDETVIRMMQNLHRFARLPIEHVNGTVVATTHYYFCVFAEGYLFWEEFVGGTSWEGADVGAIIELMQVKSIPGVIHHKLVAPSADSDIATIASQHWERYWRR